MKIFTAKRIRLVILLLVLIAAVVFMRSFLDSFTAETAPFTYTIDHKGSDVVIMKKLKGQDNIQVKVEKKTSAVIYWKLFEGNEARGEMVDMGIVRDKPDVKQLDAKLKNGLYTFSIYSEDDSKMNAVLTVTDADQ